MTLLSSKSEFSSKKRKSIEYAVKLVTEGTCFHILHAKRPECFSFDFSIFSFIFVFCLTYCFIYGMLGCSFSRLNLTAILIFWLLSDAQWRNKIVIVAHWGLKLFQLPREFINRRLVLDVIEGRISLKGVEGFKWRRLKTLTIEFREIADGRWWIGEWKMLKIKEKRKVKLVERSKKPNKVHFSNSQVPWVIYHPPCTLASTTLISLSSVTFHWYCLLVSLRVSLLLLSLHSDCYCWAMNSHHSVTFVTICRHLHYSTSASAGAMRRADSLEDCSLFLCTVEFDCDRQMLHIA